MLSLARNRRRELLTTSGSNGNGAPPSLADWQQIAMHACVIIRAGRSYTRRSRVEQALMSAEYCTVKHRRKAEMKEGGKARSAAGFNNAGSLPRSRWSVICQIVELAELRTNRPTARARMSQLYLHWLCEQLQLGREKNCCMIFALT